MESFHQANKLAWYQRKASVKETAKDAQKNIREYFRMVSFSIEKHNLKLKEEQERTGKFSSVTQEHFTVNKQGTIQIYYLGDN